MDKGNIALTPFGRAALETYSEGDAVSITNERNGCAAHIAFCLQQLCGRHESELAREFAAEELADALDHYISRSMQGWVR